MEKRYTQHTISTYTAEGDATTVTGLEANVATSLGRPGARCDMCDICGLSWSAHDIKYFRGKAYGVPCGCHEDIGSILRQERANRERPRVKPGRSERESPILYE